MQDRHGQGSQMAGGKAQNGAGELSSGPIGVMGPPKSSRRFPHPAASTSDGRVGDLIGRIRDGETHLYGEIVRRYRADVRRVALLMLADNVVTENVVQQAFINAYERLDDFRRGEDFGHWVKAIARNLVRDELKKSSRERGRMALYRDYLIAKLSTEDQGQRREQILAEALGHCRAKLPPMAARAIELRYDRELGFEEVASAIGRSAEATRQIVTRARIALKVCIQRRVREP